ncbi:MAG: cytochrome c [Nitrospinota bacterium]
MNSKIPSRKTNRIVFGVFLFSVFFISSEVLEVWAGQMGLGRRRHSRAFQGHHGQGFIGKGFCPQMRTTVQAPDNIIKQKNPIKKTPELLYAGESLFQVEVQPTACKICHGVTGNGFGIMAQGLNPPPRNFTCSETMKTISDGQLFWIIRNGSPGTGMPAFKNLSDREIWLIVHYIREFSKPKLKKR